MVAHPASSAPGSASFTTAGVAHGPGNAPGNAGAAAGTRALADLDARIASVGIAGGIGAIGGGAGGVVLARVERSIEGAILTHVARRVRASGRSPLVARAHDGAPLWREVASRLSQGQVDCDPARCAEQIMGAALLRRVVVVAPLPAAGTWDRAVAAQLAASGGGGSGALFVFVSDESDTASDIRADRFDIAGQLDAEDKQRWWSAVAEEANAVVATDDLAALEAWWASVKRRPLRDDAVDAPLADGARGLFTALALAGRAWSMNALGALGAGDEAASLLVHAGAAQVDRGFLGIARAWDERARHAAHAASSAERVAVARALQGTGGGTDPEPWVFARIADLLARECATGSTASLDEADAAHARAVSLAHDPIARREIVTRWMRAVDALPREAQLELRVRAAQRALVAGEADEGNRWAQSAAAIAQGDARVTLLLGRAAAALGDLVAARVALERARAAASTFGVEAPETVALIACELAEVAYLTGDLATADQEAHAALTRAVDPSTRLKARNTLGKILLAEAKWEAADAHFAEDVMSASAQRDATGELRASLNRGIALLSKGLIDEARAVFEIVRAEGERTSEARAVAYAHCNLGVVAMRRHEYAAALVHWEQAIKLLQHMRDRVTAAHTLANLADLRHHLGLFDHAEHAITFGRRALGAGMPAVRALHFGLVAARIALSRGHTIDARREIAGAIAEGEAAGAPETLGIAFRVATRIALEDGDLARAADMLARARSLATVEDALAEVALLNALLERASGNENLTHAMSALAAARSSSSEELLREAHVLLAELHRAAGSADAARSHAESAIALRDKMADTLPGDVRPAFLARPDVVALARLHALLVERSQPSLDEPPPTIRGGSMRPIPSIPREMVGDDPAVRGLLAAVRKVARSNSTVLVRGESGTGKELVAEALHRASDRASGPLVTVNCAALVETLLLSELFGHEKGAFTGAFARRRGRFELAEGGTLFLDEIGDISARTQVALLRVLQERTFERVGGTTPIRANVRIVCATHRDLRAMVERGEFREDLYYRLRGITLEVPALRARMGDLARISANLLMRIAAERGESLKSLSGDALELLSRHRWPGNVRELENALRAASLFAETETITASDLVDNVDDLRAVSQAIAQSAPPPRNTLLPLPLPSFTELSSDASLPAAAALAVDSEDGEDGAPLPLVEANATAVAYAQVRQGAVSLSDLKRQIERDCIARALAETKGNITRAASLLGMKRPRLSQLVKQYGLAAVSSEAS